MPTGYKKSDGTDIEDGLAPAAHDHDSEYYTEAELDTLLSGKVDSTTKVANVASLGGISAASFMKDTSHVDHSQYNNYNQHSNYANYSQHINYANFACSCY